jgi:hypothetical protein
MATNAVCVIKLWKLLLILCCTVLPLFELGGIKSVVESRMSRESMRPLSLFITLGIFGRKEAPHLSVFQYDSRGSSQFD